MTFCIPLTQNADDTQLYMPENADDDAQIRSMEATLSVVKSWMSHNFLLLNSDKTEVLFIGPARYRHQFDLVTLTLDNCAISQSLTAKNLGVTFVQSLYFDQHIKEMKCLIFLAD